MLASYLLSRTLVPTMVLYLLPSEVGPMLIPATSRRTPVAAGRSRRQCTVSFERLFERLRSGISGGIGVGAGASADHGGRVCWRSPLDRSVLLGPRLGQDFFPAVDAGQFRLHVQAPSGTRIEETEQIFGQVEDVIRSVVPADELALILDNMGLTPSFTIRAYIDNGTVSDGDGEILVSLKPEHRTHGRLYCAAARGVAEKVSRVHVLFSAGRHHEPDFGFRLACADRRAGHRINRAGNLQAAQELRDSMADSRDRRRSSPSDQRSARRCMSTSIV